MNDDVVNGALTFGCLVIALKFLRFWRLSKDSFFLWFTTAFVAIACSWGLRALDHVDPDSMYYVYVPRLAGFLLIAVAILQKNRATKREAESG